MAWALALKHASFHVRNIRLRLPFRFGVITLREVALLHLAVDVEDPRGGRARGFAAEHLIPKWFDKNPAKTTRDNVDDLLTSVRLAHEVYLAAAHAPRTVWAIWRDAYPETRRAAAELGLPPLVATYGSAFFERALIDAAGRLAGLDLIGMLRQNALDLRPGEIHPELADADPLAWTRREPPARLAVRHTVGLVDPIVAADLGRDGGPRDGLPRTLDEYVAQHGVRYFKLKVGGEADEDVERLQRIADVLDRLIPDDYVVTLDGNEQYKGVEAFHAFVAAAEDAPRLRRLLASTAFIEQPLDRTIALDPAATRGLRDLSRRFPLLIDESDGELDSFKAALALGYRGVSTKNCKGVVKMFLNRSLAERLNADRPPGERLFMSAEDLTTVPVVPLQQDLATVQALGIAHVERNGHHYVRGLAHCSPAERTAAIQRHADLYQGDAREASLRIVDGHLSVASLAVPGYGVAFDPDLASMTPLSSWRFETLAAGA